MSADGVVGYNCFNCGFKTGYQPGRHLGYKFRKLLSWLGADDGTIQRLVIDAIRIKELVNPDEIKPTTPKEEVSFRARPLPEQAQSLQALSNFYTLADDRPVPKDFHDSVLYLAKRNIDLSRYDFYWTPESQYNMHKRVIVPFTWKNQIIGYTSRAFDDTVKPKYHNSHEPNYVFNTDCQHRDSKFVVVCEGPFDAMSIDGVAVLGNSCSEVQADIIDSLSREVVVVPDTDRAGYNLVQQAIEYGWSVSFPIWMDTCKDVNQAVTRYGKLFVIKAILEAKHSSRLKIELHAKRLYNGAQGKT